MQQPLTDQQLNEIQARAKSRRVALTQWLNKYSPQPGQDALEKAEGVLEEDVPALLAEVHRLRDELADRTQVLVDTDAERERAQDMADKLAYAVASEEVIGEHTADNSPWANALDLITPAAEVDKLIRWHREDETALNKMREKVVGLRVELAEATAARAVVSSAAEDGDQP